MKAAIPNPAQQDTTPLTAEARPQLGLATPERSPAEWAICVALFLLCTAYLLLFRHSTFSPDEGITLQGAERILHGQVMYRDFFYFCTPGSYYFLALLFKVFGNSIVVAKTQLAVYGGIFAVLTYLIARRVCARWSALLTAFLVTVAFLPSFFFALHNWDSTLWAYLTLYCAVWFLQRPHWGWALAMGTCCSITALFEQSKGGGILLGLAAGFVILAVCRQIVWQRTHLLAALAGLVWPVALTIGYFANRHASNQLVSDLIRSLQQYAAVNTVPYGYLNWGRAIPAESLPATAFFLVLASPYFLFSALPLFGIGILTYSMVQIRKAQRRESARWAYYALVSACTSGLLVSVLAARKDASHFVFVSPVLSLILCWFIDRGDLRLRILDAVMPLVVGLVALALTLMAISELVMANSMALRNTRKGIVRVRNAETALDYLRAHTRPGEEIIVYPYDPAYYFLTDTSNPTAFDFVHPGLNTRAQLHEMLNIVASSRPRAVLFDPSFYEGIVVSFPEMPLRVLAAPDAVAEFLLREYRPCAVLQANTGRFVFMVRKDLSCPDAGKGAAQQARTEKRAGASGESAQSAAAKGSHGHS
jgi:4-amino-4-deoxy-L-arabinose transferase-like glycosyltransferase